MVPLTISANRKYFEICVATINRSARIGSSEQLKPNIEMKHTIETATERAIKLGYGGEYVNIMAADWVGKTEEEILEASADFNENYLRRQKYARAAEITSDPKRKAYFEGVAGDAK